MYEFPSFVYLDMEKTGSTFIFQLLNKFASEETVYRHHHQPMPADCDRSKFYFMSVRDPLDAYISLYSFGCQSQGKVYARLARRDLNHYYDGTAKGFHAWLKFALKKKNGGMILGENIDDRGIAKLIGPQSYRFIRLAIPNSRKKLDACTTREEILALYEREKLPNFFVRYETFIPNLCELIEGPLRPWFADVDAAVNFVRTADPRNASKRVDKENDTFRVSSRARKRLSDREWLLHEVFGY